MSTLLLTPAVDDRHGEGRVSSRIGLSAPAEVFHADTDLFAFISARQASDPVDCVMVDEAQFLARAQVLQLARVCDELGIPVLTFGIRTDFRGEPFTGSLYLLALADNLKEIKAICACGRKATMVLRVDESGRAVTDGEQIVIGDDEYLSVCRRHFFAAFRDGEPVAGHSGRPGTG